MSAVVVEDLRKNYGANEAVKGVSFSIEPGEVFALIGPNGAGKTSTIEILEGHRTRSSGSVSVLGFDPATGGRDYRARIGIVLQTSALERSLRVAETVAHYAAIYPRARPVDEVLEIVGLKDRGRARIGHLSGGQQRRLELALGIVGDPDLVFLDEPTTGFDPEARRQAWDLVRRLAGLGKTILLTTHYMEEAHRLADRVAVISGGRIVAEGAPGEIGGAHRQRTTIAFSLRKGLLLKDLPASVRRIANHHNGYVEIETETPTKVLGELTGMARKNRIELQDLEVTRPSLEDIYLRLVGEQRVSVDD